VSSAIVPVLAPYIGETMAQASVDAQLRKLGPSEDPLTATEVQTLIDKLGQGLNVFVGRTRANDVVQGMKAAVATIGLG
jgi:hypothetical protein